MMSQKVREFTAAHMVYYVTLSYYYYYSKVSCNLIIYIHTIYVYTYVATSYFYKKL